MSNVFDDEDTAAADAADRERGKNEPGSTNGVSHEELTSFVERIERLTEEKQAIADDIKEVKSEAKGRGFDVSTINEMLKLRKLDKADRDAREALRETYGIALGVFG